MSTGRTVDTAAPAVPAAVDLRYPGHRHLCRCFDCYLWRADTPNRRKREAFLARRNRTQRAWRARYSGWTVEEIAADQHARRVEAARLRAERVSAADAAAVERRMLRAFEEVLAAEAREHRVATARLVCDVERVRAMCERRTREPAAKEQPGGDVSPEDRQRIVKRDSQRRRYGTPLSADDPRHGRASTRKNWGCACDRCAAAAVADKVARAARREAGLPSDDGRHGTLAGYSGWGCRCERCRAGYKEHRAAVRAEKQAKGLPLGDRRHGRAAGYNEWCCRCPLCVAYNSGMSAKWKAARRAS